MSQECDNYVYCPPNPDSPLIGYQGNNVLSTDTVVNGGFETGDLTGWTLSGNIGSSHVVIINSPGGSWPEFVFAGQYGMALNGTGATTYLSQKIQLVQGQKYTFSFWWNYYDAAPNVPNTLTASFNGTQLFTTTAPGNSFGTWTNQNYTVVGTGFGDTIEFSATQQTGYNSFGLDDIVCYQIGGSSTTSPTPQPFVGQGFGPSTPPPLNWTFQRPTAFAIATSPTSQADADAAALAGAIATAQAGWTPPGQPVPLLPGDSLANNNPSSTFVGQAGAPNTPPLNQST